MFLMKKHSLNMMKSDKESKFQLKDQLQTTIKSNIKLSIFLKFSKKPLLNMSQLKEFKKESNITLLKDKQVLLTNLLFNNLFINNQSINNLSINNLYNLYINNPYSTDPHPLLHIIITTIIITITNLRIKIINLNTIILLKTINQPNNQLNKIDLNNPL